MISLGIANVLGRSAVGLGSGSTTIASAVSALVAAGRKGVLPPPQDISRGMFWRDRARTQPYTEADKERTVEFVDDLTGNPVGWQLGPDLLAGAGSFDSATGWTLGTGWSISGGFAVKTPGTASNLSFSVSLTPGKAYKVTFYVTSYSAGTVTPQFSTGTTVNGTTRAGLGVWSDTIIAVTGNDTFRINGGTTFDGTVDRVTIQEVILDESWMGPNLVSSTWTLETGWGFSGGTLTATGAAAFTAAFQASFPFVAGRVYSVTFTVTVTSGSVRVQFNGGTAVLGTTQNTSGTYVQCLAGGAGNNALRFEAQSSGFTGTITGITVREIPGHPIVSAVAGSGLVLSRRVNMLQRTEQATHAAWTPGRDGAAQLPTVSQHGDFFRVNFDCVDLSTNANRSRFSQTSFAVTQVGAVYRLRLDYRAATPADVGKQIRWALEATPNSSGIVTLGADWQTLTVDRPAITTSGSMTFLLETRGTFTNAAAASAEFRQVDVRPTFWDQFPGIPAYQRVNDGTAGVLDYDDSPVWPLHWRNVTGTQAMMTLGTVDMSAGDAGAIVASVVKLSDAAAIIAETSAVATTAGAMNISIPGISYQGRFTGSISNSFATTAFAAPHVGALILAGDISADSGSLTVNGTVAGTSSADNGTGNLGNHRFNIAGRDVGGTASLRFNGILLHLPVLVAADAGVDLQALAREYAASAGFIY